VEAAALRQLLLLRLPTGSSKDGAALAALALLPALERVEYEGGASAGLAVTSGVRLLLLLLVPMLLLTQQRQYDRNKQLAMMACVAVLGAVWQPFIPCVAAAG
jgi:hypothetical protein